MRPPRGPDEDGTPASPPGGASRIAGQTERESERGESEREGTLARERQSEEAKCSETLIVGCSGWGVRAAIAGDAPQVRGVAGGREGRGYTLSPRPFERAQVATVEGGGTPSARFLD